MGAGGDGRRPSMDDDGEGSSGCTARWEGCGEVPCCWSGWRPHQRPFPLPRLCPHTHHMPVEGHVGAFRGSRSSCMQRRTRIPMLRACHMRLPTPPAPHTPRLPTPPATHTHTAPAPTPPPPHPTPQWEDALGNFKAKLAGGQDVFGPLIRQYILNNSHRVTVVLQPDAKLGQVTEDKEKARLEATAKGLDEAGVGAGGAGASGGRPRVRVRAGGLLSLCCCRARRPWQGRGRGSGRVDMMHRTAVSSARHQAQRRPLPQRDLQTPLLEGYLHLSIGTHLPPPPRSHGSLPGPPRHMHACMPVCVRSARPWLRTPPP